MGRSVFAPTPYPSARMASVVRFGPGRETFSTARTASSTCSGFRLSGYVEFTNLAFAWSATWPSRRPCRTDSARFGVCFPRTSRPTARREPHCFPGTRCRVTRYSVLCRTANESGPIRCVFSSDLTTFLDATDATPISRPPLSRGPLVGLLSIRERIRTGSVCVCSPVLTARSTAVEFTWPAGCVPRYLALSRCRIRLRSVRCAFSPTVSASSAAAEFTNPALA
jgi:hypothetical protein